MLSRVAENLFWIGRYVERADHVARLLDEAYLLDLDAGRLAADGTLRPLESVASVLGCLPALQADAAASRLDLLKRLTIDAALPMSLRSMVAVARENARSTQETLSTEAWSQLNQLHLYLSSGKAAGRLAASPFRFFERAKRECMLFAALVDTTLPHAEAFHFLRVGRYLERMDMLARILNTHFHADVHGPQPADLMPPGSLARWVSVLRSLSAHEAYLKRHQNRVAATSVLAYLLYDAQFPHTVRFAVERCLDALVCVHTEGGTQPTPAERHLSRLGSDLAYLDTDDVFARGVKAYLDGVQEVCVRVGHDIQHAYFLN